MDITKLKFCVDMTDIDDVNDHIKEANEAIGVLDCDCDECLEPQVGDIVQLSSGSPDMTVIGYCEDNNEVDIAWYDGGGMQYATFPAECLTFED
jgi:uncharacterized protein YodC (DUF2158 family)